MKGITSGLRPVVKLRDGGFPDLTGDGKVTQKDILRGRGIEGFSEGGIGGSIGGAKAGDAGKNFYNFQKTKPGSGANLRDFTDFIFDPEDPVDYVVAGLMLFPPAGIAAKLLQMGIKGNKLKKTMNKVKKLKEAERKAGKKSIDLFTTSPLQNMAAANGLLFGPTRSTIKGAAGQMTARNELADFLYPHESVGMDERFPGLNLSSQEMRDAREEDPSLGREGGIGEFLYEMKDVPSDLAQLGDYYLLDPDGRADLAEGIRGIPSLVSDAASNADFSRYNPTNMLPDKAKKSVDKIGSKVVEGISSATEGIYDFFNPEDDPEEMANGGIMYLKKGAEVSGWLASLTKKAVEKLPKKKDGTVRMNSKEANKAKADFYAKKKAETQAKRKTTIEAKKQKAALDEAERLARIKRAADARANTKQSAQQRLNSKPAQVDVPIKGQGPAIASKVDDAFDNSASASGAGAAKKADEAREKADEARRKANEINDPIEPGDVDPPKRTFMQKVNPYVSLNLINPATKAKGTKALLGAVGGYNAYQAFRNDDETEVVVRDPRDYTAGETLLSEEFDVDTNADLLEVIDPVDWDAIMKERLVAGGKTLDDKGNFIDKPKFKDYLKALPGAYADKVSRDEDFAKKMIAGFLNMMRPVEGFVPVNSAVAFGDAYFNEETRQADMLPADAKMLEYLKGDDEAFERYLRAEQAKSGILLADTKPELARGYYDMLISSLGQTQMPGVNVLDKLNKGEIRLVYKGAPVGTIEILALMDQNVDVLRDPGFKLEEI